MNQSQRISTVKVGMLTMISLAVLITTVIWLRGRGLGSGESYEVYFKDVDGLREGATVQMMGIRVGFIDAVQPRQVDGRYRVRIKFTLTEKNIDVPKGSTLTLEQSGIIGEKFLEITPPKTYRGSLTFHESQPDMRERMPLKVQFKDRLVTIGEVTDMSVRTISRLTAETPDYQYRFAYAIRRSGYLVPEDQSFELVHPQTGKAYLLLKDEQALLVQAPRNDPYFTVEEPLRIKEFLEEQLASAVALKMTNEKINQLLSDETIATIQGTLRNSELLTVEATRVLREANRMFATTSQDLHGLVASTERLTDSVTGVAGNVNKLAGDPKLQADVRDAVRSLQQSSESMNTLLNDPNLRLILSDARVTSENAAQLSAYLKSTAVDNNLQGRLNESLTLLNSSLTRLSGVLENVETLTNDKDAVRQILEDTKETSENLNRFSERLNGRFLLFRLLF